MQSGYVWLHLNTLSRVSLSCHILCYKNKGFTCSYWHIRLSQLFLKEIIFINSCTSPLQGCNLYSSVPSLLFISSQLNIKKISKSINTHTQNCVKVGSNWKASTFHSTGINYTGLFLSRSSHLLYARTPSCSIPWRFLVCTLSTLQKCFVMKSCVVQKVKIQDLKYHC